MSAHMKRHRTSHHTVIHVIYQGNVYDIPKAVADQYKVSTVKGSHKASKNSVLADDLFADLDRKYTKPGVLLKGTRHRENLSQAEFAKKINVTQSDLSKMENGKRPIGKIIAKRIADQFDVDFRMFLG